jgi:hypothetical protein
VPVELLLIYDATTKSFNEVRRRLIDAAAVHTGSIPNSDVVLYCNCVLLNNSYVIHFKGTTYYFVFQRVLCTDRVAIVEMHLASILAYKQLIMQSLDRFV